MQNMAVLKCVGITLGVCAMGIAGAAEGAVIPVAGAGKANQVGYFPLEAAFDDQPTMDPPTGETYTSADGGGGVSMYTDAGSGRQAFIDFGADWADVRITGTWELWNQYGRTATTGDLTYWWSADKAKTFDAGDTLALDFGFYGANPPSNPTSDGVWVQRYAGPAVTPLAQYLIVSTDAGASYSNGVREWAFTGSVVPEPASLALIGAGLAMVGLRRRG